MARDSPTLTRPGLWPRGIPRHRESEAEKKVYKAEKGDMAEINLSPFSWHIHIGRRSNYKKGSEV